MFYNNELEHVITITKKKDNWDHMDEVDNINHKYEKENLAVILKKFDAQFRDKGIRYLQGEYSGGHDEGGWTDYKWLNEDKDIVTNVSFEPIAWFSLNKIYKCETDDKIQLFKRTKTHDVFQLDETTIYSLLDKTGAIAKYYSFAFEGNVSGFTCLDLKTGQYKTEGQESYEQYEDHEEEGSIYA